MDEANASFVWHEVAKMQMKHFLKQLATNGKNQMVMKNCSRLRME